MRVRLEDNYYTAENDKDEGLRLRNDSSITRDIVQPGTDHRVRMELKSRWISPAAFVFQS